MVDWKGYLEISFCRYKYGAFVPRCIQKLGGCYQKHIRSRILLNVVRGKEKQL
jgi:hypothetical protein